MRVHRGFHLLRPTPLALTIGNFDGVHQGHRVLLARLREAARLQTPPVPAAVMTFEPHPREFFSPALAPARLAPLREKLAFFAEEGVDFVFVAPFNREFSRFTADDFVQKVLHDALSVRHLIVGDDFRFGCDRRGDLAYLETAAARLGFTVESTPTVTLDGERISSSAIRQALADGDLDKAARFLGHPYTVEGRVVHGRQLGRRLGFPTANLYLRRMPLPLTGVFAIEATALGQCWPGVANVGLRPTVISGRERPLLEAHLFDFHGDLYGHYLSVRFLKKLREEQKFASLEALAAQIARDADAARAVATARDCLAHCESVA